MLKVLWSDDVTNFFFPECREVFLYALKLSGIIRRILSDIKIIVHHINFTNLTFTSVVKFLLYGYLNGFFFSSRF